MIVVTDPRRARAAVAGHDLPVRAQTYRGQVRPIYHYLAERVRAHIFLCMLAYYVECHMRQALAPLLFDDDDKATADAQRDSIVTPAKPSPKAKSKAQGLRTEDDLPVHSFQTMLADLTTIAKSRIRPKLAGADSFNRITSPTREVVTYLVNICSI